MEKSGCDKRGQVTIFIILAIVIVIGIAAFFILRPSPSAEISPRENPLAFIEKCMQDGIDEVLPSVLAQAGFAEIDKSPDKSLIYQDKHVHYLCYVEEELTLCTINTPMLKSEMETQLRKATQPKLEGCFAKLKEEFSGYEYTESNLNYTISISPNNLKATAIKKITVSRDGLSQEFNSFIYETSSPIFDFLLLSNDILVDELSCICGQESCTTDVLELSRFNPYFQISVFVAGNDEKVYTIKDTRSQQEFKFAVRNCIN